MNAEDRVKIYLLQISGFFKEAAQATERRDHDKARECINAALMGIKQLAPAIEKMGGGDDRGVRRFLDESQN